ncbi:hypothetical protein [Oligoflexus tunisiensis]|uniref:hypothetical protein n=1 Tax=Oligoflexus tunisiensis TaxID=708132 RepID=UPI00114CCFCA|nr:hypothetical protein [Oligoflexus tunisiensis]
MKKMALFILLLLSLSWISSLAEGLLCDEKAHEPVALVDPSSSTDKDVHPCHAESCHFGHCGHLHARWQASPMEEPDSHHHRNITPYSFIVRSGPRFLPMRPPLA